MRTLAERWCKLVEVRTHPTRGAHSARSETALAKLPIKESCPTDETGEFRYASGLWSWLDALPSYVAVRVAGRVRLLSGEEVGGNYFDRLLQIAIYPHNRFDPARIFGVARHELMHALRNLDLFDDAET